METKSTTRVLTLMDSVGISQVKFAERCGIRPSNFNRALKSEKGLSSQYLLRIAHAFNVNFEWLRNGIGEMFAEEKAIGKAQPLNDQFQHPIPTRKSALSLKEKNYILCV